MNEVDNSKIQRYLILMLIKNANGWRDGAVAKHYLAEEWNEPLLSLALDRNAPDFVLRSIKTKWFTSQEAIQAIEMTTDCKIPLYTRLAITGPFKNDIIVHPLNMEGLDARYKRHIEKDQVECAGPTRTPPVNNLEEAHAIAEKYNEGGNNGR